MPPVRTQTAPSCQTCHTAGRGDRDRSGAPRSGRSSSPPRRERGVPARDSRASTSMGETLRVAEERGRRSAHRPGSGGTLPRCSSALSRSRRRGRSSRRRRRRRWRSRSGVTGWRPGARAVDAARHRDELTRPGSARASASRRCRRASSRRTSPPGCRVSTSRVCRSATALVATQPVWAALLARRAGHASRDARGSASSIAVVGAGCSSRVPTCTVSARALGGDLLALVGGFFAAAYMVAGGEVRRQCRTATYTTVCYADDGAGLAAAAVSSGGRRSPATPASPGGELVAVTLGRAVPRPFVVQPGAAPAEPDDVSLSILFEVPGASLHRRAVAAPAPARSPRSPAWCSPAGRRDRVVIAARQDGRTERAGRVDLR